MRTKEIMKNQQMIAKNTKAIAAGGGGGSGVTTVKDGDTTVTNPTTIDFAGDAVVTESPAGTAVVTVSGGGSAPKTGFSPTNVAMCSEELDFDAITEWGAFFLSVVEETMTINRVDVFGVDEFDTGDVKVMIYRYGWGTGAAVGLATGACGYGPNTLSFVAQDGQTLDFTAGDKILIAIRRTSGSWKSPAANCFDEKMYCQIPNVPEPPAAVDFPLTAPVISAEEWTNSGFVPAMTLWESA